jgi:DNA-binding CsgD family transcriptional regulator
MAQRGRPPHPGPLTPAEARVLEHVRAGLPNAEIAVRLGISVNTVRYHVSNLLAKAGASTREELARWRPKAERKGLRWGWLSLLGWKPVVVGLAAVGVVGVGAVVIGLVLGPYGGGESAPAASESPTVAAFDSNAAAKALASPALRDDSRQVLELGISVPFTCHGAGPWERPPLDHMSSVFTNPRFGNGKRPTPVGYSYYLAEVLYQQIPWASSANVDFYSLSGLNGGDNQPAVAPDSCPVRSREPTQVSAPQAIYFVGMEPLGIWELAGHAVVVAKADPGILHKVVFERPLVNDKGTTEPRSFDRMDVVMDDGSPRFVQDGQERWQAGDDGKMEFVAGWGEAPGELPLDLPVTPHFDTYRGGDPNWLTYGADVPEGEADTLGHVGRLTSGVEGGLVLLRPDIPLP